MKDSHKILNKQVLDKEKKIKELKDKIECDSRTILIKSDEYIYVCENLYKLSNDIKYHSDIDIELAKDWQEGVQPSPSTRPQSRKKPDQFC